MSGEIFETSASFANSSFTAAPRFFSASSDNTSPQRSLVLWLEKQQRMGWPCAAVAQMSAFICELQARRMQHAIPSSSSYCLDSFRRKRNEAPKDEFVSLMAWATFSTSFSRTLAVGIVSPVVAKVFCMSMKLLSTVTRKLSSNYPKESPKNPPRPCKIGLISLARLKHLPKSN